MVNFKSTIVNCKTYLLTLLQTTWCKNHCPGSLKDAESIFDLMPCSELQHYSTTVSAPILHLHVGLCDAH